MVGKNDGSINAGLKEIIQIIQAVAQGSAVYYVIRETWLVMQAGTNSNFCRRCNATGRITCNKCCGTSTLRRRPAVFSPIAGAWFAPGGAGDVYKCPYSGPRGTFDIPPTADQLEDASSYRVHLAEELEDLLKKAAMDRVPARPFKPLAGTVRCPECDGNVRVKGLVNIANVFGGLKRQWGTKPRWAGFLRSDQLPVQIQAKPAPRGGAPRIAEYPAGAAAREAMGSGPGAGGVAIAGAGGGASPASGWGWAPWELQGLPQGGEKAAPGQAGGGQANPSHAWAAYMRKRRLGPLQARARRLRRTIEEERAREVAREAKARAEAAACAEAAVRGGPGPSVVPKKYKRGRVIQTLERELETLMSEIRGNPAGRVKGT